MNGATPLSKLAKVYGKDAMVSIVNGYNIIHLDDPTDEQVKQRIQEVLNGQVDDDLEDDCPLCQTMKGQPCDIVYYKQ
ncbi:MAG: hypothetical protein KBB52_03150 [Candidatus Omnitrophica bacterium]|nr:hypothetical protein [Candidatus Omnitrophota bacterium]